jgi:ATP-binding protein involved in chromosome partitioning
MKRDLSQKEREILEKLKDVRDPEMGFSIVEAELVDDVKAEGDKAKVIYHLTTPYCPPPFALYIGRGIRKKAKEVDGINEVEVTVKDRVNADEIDKSLKNMST